MEDINLPNEGKPARTVIIQIPGPRGRDGKDGERGPAGKNGKDGKEENPTYPPSSEFRFAVNGSSIEHPSLNFTDPDPEGWSKDQPDLEFGQFLWMIHSLKTVQGELVNGTWPTPVRLSGIQGPPGADGDGSQGPGNGQMPPSLIPRGLWSNIKAYFGNPERIDIVTYNGHYYVARVDAGNIPVGTLPTNTNFWNPFDGEYENVATNLLLAQSAYIGWLQSNSVFIGEPGFPMLKGWELGGEAIKSIQKREDGTTPKTTLTSEGKIDTIDASIAGTLKVKGDDIIEVGDLEEGESGFSWNRDDGLTLRGAILQDTSGAKIIIPRFRGAYNTGTVYIEGDQVTENGSTFIAVYASPFSGIATTNTTYWAVFASKGIDGGNAGPAGPAGPSYVRKYAKNGSTTSPPTQENINSASGPGAAWSTSVPSTSIGEYVWASEAKFSSDGVTLLSAWSLGARLTGLAGTNGTNGANGAPGAPGQNGLNGPAVAYRATWSAAKTYKGTHDVIEVVGYGSLYYYTRVDAGTFTSSITPNLDTTHWNVYGSVFESIATGFLFAELAYIDNLGVRNMITSETGRRIEINQATNAVIAKDDSGNFAFFGVDDATYTGFGSSGIVRVQGDAGGATMQHGFVSMYLTEDPFVTPGNMDDCVRVGASAIDICKNGAFHVGQTQVLNLSGITQLVFTNGILTSYS